MQQAYLWASLVSELVKNLPVMWETWVLSLGWKDPLEKGTTTCSRILAWKISRATVHGVAKSRTRLNDVHFHNIFSCIRMDIYLIMLSLMSKITALEFLEKMLVHLNVHVWCGYTYCFWSIC